MIQILGYTQGNIIAAKATNELTKSDYEKLIPLLKVKIDQFKRIRLYFEMEDVKVWEDFKCITKLKYEFEKIALVGETCQEHYITDLMEPFSNCKIKCFAFADKDIALKWMKL